MDQIGAAGRVGVTFLVEVLHEVGLHPGAHGLFKVLGVVYLLHHFIEIMRGEELGKGGNVQLLIAVK